ncbi:hypothetical protein CKM354_000166900 [Cercospora kikuchii]|uniref:Uncharacterized protein n=1 Tax=Cercospora kikuchii TaxID=84275 RepID=A0A9P3CGJ3_9PEZI|nr:uncharacterized protein CKM354_000166900 [Cercospora kikuchii]GIZ38248.1 hypothetical protein CKM354_000166900 [Cercospora kikuchii]
MAPSNKRRRIERIERNAAFLRHFQPNFNANELELLDELFDDATLPSAEISKRTTQRWRIRLEDLLYKAGENMGLAQELVAKVVKERTGNSTYEVIPDDLYNVHDQFSYAEGKRDTLDNLKGVPEVKDWAARMHADAVEEPEADGSDCGGEDSDSTSGMVTEEKTGPAQKTDKELGGPGYAEQHYGVAVDSDFQMQERLVGFHSDSHLSSPPFHYSSPQSSPGSQAYKPATPSMARIPCPTGPGGYRNVPVERRHGGRTLVKRTLVSILEKEITTTSIKSDHHRTLDDRIDERGD